MTCTWLLGRTLPYTVGSPHQQLFTGLSSIFTCTVSCFFEMIWVLMFWSRCGFKWRDRFDGFLVLFKSACPASVVWRWWARYCEAKGTMEPRLWETMWVESAGIKNACVNEDVSYVERLVILTVGATWMLQLTKLCVVMLTERVNFIYNRQRESAQHFTSLWMLLA